MTPNHSVAVDNPAGRVWHILDKARNVKNDKAAQYGWAVTFNIAEGDDLTLFEHLAELQGTMARARRQFARTGGLQHHHDPFPKLASVVNVSLLSQPWRQLVPQIDPQSMTTLAFVSSVLSKDSDENSINPEDLDKLLTEVDALLKFSLAAEIDESLKKVIVEQLNAIRNSIFFFKLRGVAGLRESVKSSLGTILLHADLFKTSPGSPIFEKFMKLLDRLAGLVRRGKEFKELVEPMIGHFLGEE